MADTVPDHYVTEYSNNWISRVQQTQGRLDGFIEWKDFLGERKRFDRLDQMTAQVIAARKAATRVSDASDDFRWCTAEPYDVTNQLDEFDAKQLGQLVLPTSDYVRQHGNEFHRVYDDITWTAAIGNVLTGKLGTTSTALPSSQKLTDGGALTVEKLIDAATLLDEADLDLDAPRVICWTAKMKKQLLNTTKATSRDYNSVQALVKGDIKEFCGFTFKQIQRLPTVSGTTKKLIGWQQGAMRGIKGMKMSHIDVLPDFQHTIQMRSVWRGGACRIHDELVFEMHIDEAA